LRTNSHGEQPQQRRFDVVNVYRKELSRSALRQRKVKMRLWWLMGVADDEKRIDEGPGLGRGESMLLCDRSAQELMAKNFCKPPLSCHAKMLIRRAK